jgi:hypothetical protein
MTFSHFCPEFASSDVPSSMRSSIGPSTLLSQEHEHAIDVGPRSKVRSVLVAVI